MKKHASWYLKDVRGRGRKVINQTNTRDELVSILEQFVEEQQQEISAI